MTETGTILTVTITSIECDCFDSVARKKSKSRKIYGTCQSHTYAVRER